MNELICTCLLDEDIFHSNLIWFLLWNDLNDWNVLLLGTTDFFFFSLQKMDAHYQFSQN